MIKINQSVREKLDSYCKMVVQELLKRPVIIYLLGVAEKGGGGGWRETAKCHMPLIRDHRVHLQVGGLFERVRVSQPEGSQENLEFKSSGMARNGSKTVNSEVNC